jgi:hypothetical protein
MLGYFGRIVQTQFMIWTEHGVMGRMTMKVSDLCGLDYVPPKLGPIDLSDLEDGELDREISRCFSDLRAELGVNDD